MNRTALGLRAWILRLTIQAGDVEIDLEGAAIQIDEQMTHVKAEHTWTVLLERIREARESAMEAAVTAAREAGLPERGSAFRACLRIALSPGSQTKFSGPFTTSETSKASATAPHESSTSCSPMQASSPPATSPFTSTA